MKHMCRQFAVMGIGLPGLSAVMLFLIMPLAERIDTINVRVFVIYCGAFACAILLVSCLSWAISRDVNDEMKDR